MNKLNEINHLNGKQIQISITKNSPQKIQIRLSYEKYNFEIIFKSIDMCQTK